MDRLESMSVLLSVVESGSLSAASRKLGIPLASISRKVSELEAHLKVRLLNRTTRSLELTDEGRVYLASCRRILDEIGEAERLASGEYREPKGRLVITASVVFGRLHILPVVTEFLKAYPQIDVQLILTDRMVDMMEEQVDVAVRIGELPDSAMLATRVGWVRQVVCGSPAYFKKNGIPKSPKELMNHDCVTIETIDSPTAWNFPKGKDTVSVSINSRLIVSTVEAGIDAAVAGTGITRALLYQVAPLEADGKLKIILKEFEPPSWPVQLVHNGHRIVPLKLRAYLEFATPRLRDRLPQQIK